MTQIGVWRAQNASKPSENIINTPPKYPQTRLETFFSGHFSPQIAQKRLSPPGRLLGISPTASAKTGILAINWAQGLKIRIFLAHRLRNHHAQLLGRRKNWPKRPLRAPRPDFWDFGQKQLSPQVTRHTPHRRRAREPVFST